MPQALELPIPEMERIAPDLWVAPLAEGLWITCATGLVGGLWYPANGLIVADGSGSTLVDPGWTRDQAANLLRHATERLKRPVARAIATHFHSDRVGGLEALRRVELPFYAHPLTVGLARAYGTPEPDPLPELAKGSAQIGGVELFYPGPGHTRDNITAWHGPSRTLFGGCLLKSATAPSIGNVEDADLIHYDETLDRLVARYPSRARTIPGHGSIAGDPIAATRALLIKAHAKE